MSMHTEVDKVRSAPTDNNIPLGARVRAFVRAASLETEARQHDAIEALCKRIGIQTEQTYAVDGHGTREISSHPVIHLMLADACSDKFDVLLLEDASRLSRDTSTLGLLLDILEPHVRMVSFDGHLLTRHNEILSGFMSRETNKAVAARRASMRAWRKSQAAPENRKVSDQ